MSSRAWQQLVAPEHKLNVGRIAGDLARYDVHPPLYFWLLHGWSLVVGVTARTGPLLNLLIDVGTGLALYRLARGLFAVDRALAAVVLWALSPASLGTMAVARPYGLFTLMVVLYALVCVVNKNDSPQSTQRAQSFFMKKREKKRFFRAGSFILIGAAGLLTRLSWSRSNSPVIMGIS